jgi:hypothetical protein
VVNADDVAVQVSFENTGAAGRASATSSISAIVVSIGPGAVSSGLDLGGLLQILVMGDIYTTEYGGTLQPRDPRTQDYEQVMNAYDGPQRTLGNGDKTGAQLLYGMLDGPNYIYRMWNPYITDHLYTTNYNEYLVGAVSCGYGQEGIFGYLYNTGETGTIPLYRLWNPQIKDHLYTTNYDEYSTGAARYGYQQEGLVGYIMSLS